MHLHISVLRLARRHSTVARLLLVATGLASAAGVYAFWWEPSQLVVTRSEIVLPSQHAIGTPLRIAALSDIHVGSPYITLDKLRSVVERTNAERPDAVVLLGDFVINGVKGGTPTEPEAFAGILGGFRAPLGVFAVLGNHDWREGRGPRIAEALRAQRIHVLLDQAVRIERDHRPLWFVGFEDLWRRNPNPKAAVGLVRDDALVFALTHNPDIFPEVPARVALTIAGHTHGGQVDLPFLGRLKVPSWYGTRYAAGHIVEGGRHLFVTTGIGTSIIPVRFRVPPEIAIITVRSDTAGFTRRSGRGLVQVVHAEERRGGGRRRG